MTMKRGRTEGTKTRAREREREKEERGGRGLQESRSAFSSRLPDVPANIWPPLEEDRRLSRRNRTVVNRSRGLRARISYRGIAWWNGLLSIRKSDATSGSKLCSPTSSHFCVLSKFFIRNFRTPDTSVYYYLATNRSGSSTGNCARIAAMCHTRISLNLDEIFF